MKKYLIIGSTAAHHWHPDIWTHPKDIDVLTQHSDITFCDTSKKIEVSWHGMAQVIIDVNVDPVYCDPQMLLTLKFSHAPWNVWWEKTMLDVWRFQKLGYTPHWDLLPELRKVWAQIHGKKHVNLNRSVEEFFANDYVSRRFFHEDVHNAVAFYDQPMHTRIRPDLNSVWCSRDMFNDLPMCDRIKTCMEEIAVTAIERKNLTSQSSKFDVHSAITYAHRQLITSMTSGWFTDFLIWHAFDLLGNEGRAIIREQIFIGLEKLEK